jgi:type III pantothenate kinase
MLFAIDIGNTNIVLGLFKGDNILEKWRIATDLKKTADEYFIIFENLLKDLLEKIDSAIFSSVVPELDFVFNDIFLKKFNLKPIIVNYNLKLNIKLRYRNPAEIGADRIVNAVAASEIYKPPLIIIDFGTANTVCFVDKDYNYYGGLILPGINILRDTLHRWTAKLPKVSVIKPDSIIADNTVGAIQNGIYYQTVGGINYIIDLILKNYEKSSKIILTGGLANLFKDDIDYDVIFDPDLTLKGLNIIYKLNKG